MVVVCLGLAPFLSGLLFSLDETQIWLGDLRVVVVVGPVCLLVCFDLPAFMDQLCPCTNVFLTAYAHVRTEPQSDIGQTRGKKKEVDRYLASALRQDWLGFATGRLDIDVAEILALT